MSTQLDWRGWQLEEDAAEAYERYMVPAFAAPWADLLLDAAALREGERVLDVGCGTGIVAREAAARVTLGGSVTGVDLNPGMLEVARARAAALGRVVEWRQASATELPFPDGAFDLVLSQQVLQFVPEPGRALDEMRRVLAPGGRLALSVWRGLEFNAAYETFAHALELYAGPEAGAMMRAPFPAWDGDDLRHLVRQASFEEVRIRVDTRSMRFPSAREMVRQEAASSPLAGPIANLPESAREAFVSDLTEALRFCTDDDGVVFPMEAYTVLARAD